MTKSIRRNISLLLAVTIVMAFIPTMVFADQTDDLIEDEAYYNLHYCEFEEAIIEERLDGTLVLDEDYVCYGSRPDMQDSISKENPYIFDTFLLIQIGIDTYKILRPDEVVVKDEDDNIVEGVVAEKENSSDGFLRLTFTEEGDYTIVCTKQVDKIKEIYTLQVSIADESKLISKFKSSKVTNVKATAKKGSITVKWKRCSNANKYIIYRSTKKSSGFKKIATTNKASYVDKKSLKKGKTYYYKIKASTHLRDGVYTKYSTTVKAVAK